MVYYNSSREPLDDNVRRLDTAKHEDAVLFNLNQAIRFLSHALQDDLRDIRSQLDRIEARLKEK